MLQFCPVCKNLLMIKEEKGKSIGYCSCGFKRAAGIDISSSEIEKNEKMKKSTAVASEDKLMGFEHECSKCGHGIAEIKELGEVLDNESSVNLYKCKKCGHVEREIMRG